MVDELRAEGVKAGLLRLRTFRPFPAEAVRSALKNVKAIAVMDKSMSFGGNGGAVFHEIRHAMYDVQIHVLSLLTIFTVLAEETQAPKTSRKSSMICT